MRAKRPADPVIVRRKIIRESEDEHESGTWKIAYADFTTAMMALFIVLWLVSITSEEQRDQLADFFNPVSVSRSHSGSDGVLSGRIIDDSGALDAKPVQPAEPEHRTPQVATLQETLAAMIGAGDADATLRDHLLIRETARGIHITLMDRADFSMFAIGSDRLHPRARDYLASLAALIRDQDAPVAIAGHTDARSFAQAAPRNNWDLSTARAHAARTVLLRSGLEDGRLSRVEGHAERAPLIASDPLDARNRRVEIVLLKTDGERPSLLPGDL